MIVYFIIIFNHQIPYMVSSISIQCSHTTSNKIFVSYDFYKLQWLPTVSNRIQTPYPKNNILQDFPASISSMFFFLPSMGYPLLETCFYPHVSWVTCSSLCLENTETIFFAQHILYHHSRIGRNVTTAFHTIQRWSLTTHLGHLYFIIIFPS